MAQLHLLQEAHVNSCYKHFFYFVVEFKLIEGKEFEPLVSNLILGDSACISGGMTSTTLSLVTCDLILGDTHTYKFDGHLKIVNVQSVSCG